MAVQLTRREYLSTSAAALATTGIVRSGKKKSAAASIPPVEALITGDEPKVDFEKYRKIIVSPDVNPPEPFRGFRRLLWVADGVPAAERRPVRDLLSRLLARFLAHPLGHAS